MQTVQIVLDEPLLRAADRAARRAKKNRSELMREALREHLRRLEIRAMEERDREGYKNLPDTAEDATAWEAVEAWPEE
jgi:metal-responsive CopG/Arc/MetJ family transcriptional regulator